MAEVAGAEGVEACGHAEADAGFAYRVAFQLRISGEVLGARVGRVEGRVPAAAFRGDISDEVGGRAFFDADTAGEVGGWWRTRTWVGVGAAFRSPRVEADTAAVVVGGLWFGDF